MEKFKKSKLIKKNIIVIEGPSGAGKDSIIATLMANHPDTYEKITSITTRPMRPGEIDGVTYKFVSVDTFEEMLRSKEIFEFTQRHGTYRGMSKPLIDKIIDNNRLAVKDCDLVGVRALKKTYPNKVLTIFIMAPKEVIEQRIIARGDCDKDRARRLVDYDNTIKSRQYFDFVVDNVGTLDEVSIKVHDIIWNNN